MPASSSSRRVRRDAAVHVQEQDDEAGDRDLRRQEASCTEPEQPRARIAHRLPEVVELRLRRRRLADERQRDDRAADARAAEHEKREPCSARGREPRQARCGGGAADRDRRLAHAEREAALAQREPAHHRAPARRVHGCTERARDEEQRDERAVRVRPAARRSARAPAIERPSAITIRSCRRSASSPHGSSVKSMPMPTAPSTTPVSPSESR